MNLIEAQYKLLGHEGFGITEIRQNTFNDCFSGDFLHGEKQVKEFKVDKDRFRHQFISVNPRKSNLGKAEDVSYLTCLVFDIDPKNKLIQSDEVIRYAVRVAIDFPNSVVVSSGSGAHLYIPIVPIKIENYKALSESIKRWFLEIEEKYKSPSFKWDHITHDLARMIRLWGSINPKNGKICKPVGELPAEFPRTEIHFSQDSGPISTTVRTEINPNFEDRFNQILKLNPIIYKIFKAKSFEDLGVKSRSEVDYMIVNQLVKSQFNPDEIKVLIKNFPAGSGKEEKYREVDVDRIIEKLENKNGTKSFTYSGSSYFTGLVNRKPGIMTSFPRLNEMLSGLHRQRLYTIAARTNEGKTSFLTQLSLDLAKQGMRVLYFPTELGAEPLFDKIVSQKTEIDLKKFQSGAFTVEDKNKINSIQKDILSLPFIVHEDFGLTIEKVEEKIREILPDILVLDFIQAMKYEEGSASEISDNVRRLKEIAGFFNIPVLLASQLNRVAVGSEVSLTHLKGSGALEEFSDVVMVLSTLDRLTYPRPVDLFILKSRYSDIGKTRLNFYSSIGKFQESE